MPFLSCCRTLLAGAAVLLSAPAVNAQTLLLAGGKSFRVHESPCIALSTDEGKTWNLAFEGARKNLDNPSSVTGLAYGNGRIVAVTGYGAVITSTDRGKTWAVQDIKTQLNLNGGFFGVAYGGGMFLAAGQEDALAYSLDGQTWQRLGAAAAGVGSPTENATVAATQTAKNRLGGLVGGKLGGLSGLAKTAANSGGSSSPAARGAETYHTNIDPTEPTKYTHTYGVDFIGGRFYLTGNFGRVAVFVPENGKPRREKVDHVKEDLSCSLNGVATDGQGHLVAFAKTMMRSAYSADGGRSWEQDFDVKPILVGGSYGAGRFVAVSAFGDVATSPDGRQWTSRNIGGLRDGGSLTDAAYTGKNWVLCGNGNCTWLSTDNAKTWQRTSSEGLYLGTMLVVK